ncbi:MAG: IS1380 family transposase, partial [Pseudomonadota bacterium]|nr:IS1380 family transposase [Pseudomonadota bacterium]
MGASQTVLPFKLAASDESLSAHGGLALLGEYLRAMGIRGLIDHELPGPSSAAGYSPSVHVLPLVLMLAGCGRTRE